MRTIDDIINWDVIIKNRRGPFKLALKDEGGFYICQGNTRSDNPDDIYDYFSKYAKENGSEVIYDKRYFKKEKGEILKIVIVSAAGEIRLLEKDFRKMKKASK